MQSAERTLHLALRWAALVVVASASAATAQVDFRSVNSQWSYHRDDGVRGSDVPQIDLGFLAPAFEKVGDTRLNLNCLITAKQDGDRVKLNGAWFGGEVVNLTTGAKIHTFKQKFNRFGPDARFSWGYPDLSDAAQEASGFVGVALAGELDGEPLVNNVLVQCRWQARLPCQENVTTACVQGNDRFQIDVFLANGQASIVGGTFNGATFDLQDPDEKDLTVKVLNGCPQNDHFQVSAKSDSEIGQRIRVVDLQTGFEVDYSHEAGEPFKNINDTAAFPTCP